MVLPGQPADDAALISSAQAGETAAFSELFERYYEMVHALCHRLCLNSSDADDVAQETFVRAARALDRFRGGDFRCWLFRIATNSSRDLHRTMARRREMAEMAEEWQRERADRGLDPAPVREALASLPEALRAVVALVYMEGLNHAEAARVLGCAETTVSWRLFRARRQLRAILSKPLS
jgi:RNA polymerase sigma-70 factor (ECF subfamily)